MNYAQLYHDNNLRTCKGSMSIMEEYKNKIQWKDGCRVVDVGSGEGRLTCTVLKKYLPSGYSELLGVDISETMIKHANALYEDDRTRFTVIDIAAELPADLKGKFDHAFSFYAVQWVQDQEKTLKNIYNLLNEGGDCFLVFITHSLFYAVYLILAKTEKWKPWLHRAASVYASPYHGKEDPVAMAVNYLEQAGFKDIETNHKNMEFGFNSTEDLIIFLESISPDRFNMPKDLFNELMLDYVDVLTSLGRIEKKGDTRYVNIYYNLLIVQAKK